MLKHWERRNLTPIGRITVIKSLAVSKLVHLFIALPNPPKDIIQQLNNIFFEFLWKSPVSKIKKKVVTQYYEKGGLKMIDIENFIDTMKMSWMKRILKGSAKWQSIIGADIDINQVLTLGPLYALQNVVKSKNQFWLDVFQSWNKLVKRYGEDDKIIQDHMASCVMV